MSVAETAALNKGVAPPSRSFLLVQETDLKQPVRQAVVLSQLHYEAQRKITVLIEYNMERGI